jgi:hypothetical protein
MALTRLPFRCGKGSPDLVSCELSILSDDLQVYEVDRQAKIIEVPNREA